MHFKGTSQRCFFLRKLIGHMRQRPRVKTSGARPDWSREISSGPACAERSSPRSLLIFFFFFFPILHSECSEGEALKQTPKPERSACGFPLAAGAQPPFCLDREAFDASSSVSALFQRNLICFSSHEPGDSGLRLFVAEGTWLAESGG